MLRDHLPGFYAWTTFEFDQTNMRANAFGGCGFGNLN